MIVVLIWLKKYYVKLKCHVKAEVYILTTRKIDVPFQMSSYHWFISSKLYFADSSYPLNPFPINSWETNSILFNCPAKNGY